MALSALLSATSADSTTPASLSWEFELLVAVTPIIRINTTINMAITSTAPCWRPGNRTGRRNGIGRARMSEASVAHLHDAAEHVTLIAIVQASHGLVTQTIGRRARIPAIGS